MSYNNLFLVRGADLNVRCKNGNALLGVVATKKMESQKDISVPCL